MTEEADKRGITYKIMKNKVTNIYFELIILNFLIGWLLYTFFVNLRSNTATLKIILFVKTAPQFQYISCKTFFDINRLSAQACT